jgi:hypothetical protein
MAAPLARLNSRMFPSVTVTSRCAGHIAVSLHQPDGSLGRSFRWGKSTWFFDPTLLRCQLRSSPDRRYRYQDVSIKSLTDNIALVDQETTLFNETIANNIATASPMPPWKSY